MKIGIAVWIMLGAMAAGIASYAEDRIVLADKGKSDYVIVIPDDAIPSEQHAAEEFAGFLKEISGAEIAIHKAAAGTPERMILLGRTSLTKDAQGEDAALGPEEFVIRCDGSSLIIAGGRPRGTLYGVYDFLEDDLGCRWFSAKVSRIPKLDRIELGPISRREAPAFEYREAFYTDAFDPDFCARNKMNSANAPLDETRGGNVSYHHFVHSFNQIISPDEYFDEHPEYFSYFNGARQRDGSQLCLTNPDVLRIAKETVRKWIAERPDAAIYSVSQNDCYGFCECPACKAIADEEGSQAGPLLRFVNAIADDIARDHPDKLIDTLAYQWSDVPPKITKPHKNVRIRMCPIAACEAHPYAECEKNQRFVEILKGWSAVTDKLYIWHYNTDFAHYLLPFPDLVQLISSLRLYKENGVIGVFCEGNYAPGGGGSFDELKAYLIAKMLWDPKVDAWAVVDDFLKGYYGEAAPSMRRYIDLLQSQLTDGRNHFGIYSGPQDVGYLNDDVIAQAEKLFDEAEKAVAADPDALQRVRHERLGIEYVKIARKMPGADLDAFLERCRSDGVQQISEGRSLDTWEQQMRAAQ
jgi:hypothetical protein